MNSIIFEWDEQKNQVNQKKHAVTFEEAMSVFTDEKARFMADPNHSRSEDRFILLGLSASLRTLVVCHCYRKKDNAIRIISARKATRKERIYYNKGWGK